MNKGFIQAGNLLLTVFFLVMAAAAFYLYFFHQADKLISPIAEAKNDQANIAFIHPHYQYSLKLPSNWKNKYEVIEGEDETFFWYQSSVGERDQIFSIQYLKDERSLSPRGESKRLGILDGITFVLNFPDRVSEAYSADNSQMRRDVIKIGETFSVNPDSPDAKITKYLASIGLTEAPSTKLKFSSFETIATQENSTTTEFYIWYATHTFGWDGFRLRDWAIESKPARVTIVKEDSRVVAFRTAREGANYQVDVKKIFPETVRTSVIFDQTTIDHANMLEKLSDRLNEQVLNYFGTTPVLMRAGFIKQMEKSQDGLMIKAFLAESVKITSTTANLVDVSKTVTQFSVSDFADPLSLPSSAIKNKSGKIVATTSAQLVPPSQWSELFSVNGTSTWLKKPFWLQIKNNQVIKLEPIQ